MRPVEIPIGLLVSSTAKVLSREFDAALAAVGGSRPTWLVLLSLKTAGHRTQGELADAVGIRQPTLSHHLDGLEREGLVRRERTADNRRVQRVTVTEAGEALFLRLRRAAGAFDGRLRAGLDETEVAELRRLLAQLAENAPPD
ncbi:MarR family transcriptional regulator [Blastococcus sp. CT_GayMR16]|uniref:MarR family winged helix-turn-helix transcriptional regulator n=1 Tax=Blastococcus sp. CT_GayMR16 TaxID=2559607 RepID=UPI0010730112|nr:MarR family transcriptional regulator [Blastococcus sp. CT_GayMR16]TFV87366.1 MarR family transcriptional regulator [Blastococcus sp. CT_GayMR16]